MGIVVIIISVRFAEVLRSRKTRQAIAVDRAMSGTVNITSYIIGIRGDDIMRNDMIRFEQTLILNKLGRIRNMGKNLIGKAYR